MANDAYAAAFYELAEMMGIPAQPLSPETVWEQQMKPRLAALLATEPESGAADERETFDQRERADWGDLHRFQQRGPNLIKPRLGGHIVRWAADEIAALRAALERTAS